MDSYYLWLIPPDYIYKEFEEVIGYLSRQCDSPVFQPHITLVSGIHGAEEDVIARARSLADSLAPVEILFEGIETNDDFFTALYVRAQLRPTLRAAYSQAVEHFRLLPSNDYRPHLSLLYGNIEESDKHSIIRTLHALPNHFDINTLRLVKGHSEVSEWQEIENFTLSSYLS